MARPGMLCSTRWMTDDRGLETDSSYLALLALMAAAIIWPECEHAARCGSERAERCERLLLVRAITLGRDDILELRRALIAYDQLCR